LFCLLLCVKRKIFANIFAARCDIFNSYLSYSLLFNFVICLLIWFLIPYHHNKSLIDFANLYEQVVKDTPCPFLVKSTDPSTENNPSIKPLRNSSDKSLYMNFGNSCLSEYTPKENIYCLRLASPQHISYQSSFPRFRV